MSVDRFGARRRVHGEALPLAGRRSDVQGAMDAARTARRRVRQAACERGERTGGRLSRLLLALAMLLGVAFAIPAALPSSAAGPQVSSVLDPSGFPIYYEDANGVRLDPCLDTTDSHCPLLPDPGFDTQEPIAFPTNFPSEFFYQTVETDRIATPGCVGSAVLSAATPGTVQLRLALEGAFINENPAINDQMVFARVRVIVSGGLCPNTTYTFTHPYGTFDMSTDAEGIIKPSPGTTDIGCVPTTQVTCDFTIALASTMLTQGFLRWDPAIAPPADPGYLAGDPGTFHEITGGLNGVNSFTVHETANPVNVVASTNLFTVTGRLAGPVVSAPQLLDFGGVAVGQTATQDVTLTNIGAAAWLFSSATVDHAAFGVSNLSCPTAAPGLARDQTCQVRVSFTPAVVGQVGFDGATLLSVGHDGLHSPFTMVVRGTGINPGAEAGVVVNPTALNFGQVRVGLLGAAQTVAISNNGQAPLQVQSLEFVTTASSFDSNDDEAFRLTFDGCANAIVPEGGVAHCDVLVAFQPTVARPYAAALRLHANISGQPVEVDLLATGIGGVAAVSKDANGVVVTDPTNGFPIWYQDELGQRVGQCLDALDPYCLVLPDDFYTGGTVGGIQGNAYVNFPEEFFWYQAESEPVATDGCGNPTEAADAFVVIAGEGAFVNGPPIVGEGMSFGRVRVVADGLCPNTDYTVVHPYGQATVRTDDLGRVRRGIGTQDIGCVPPAGQACDWAEALVSPVFGGFLRQTNPPAGYLGDPNTFQTVTGAPYVADREIELAGGGTPASANYFRIFKTDAPETFSAETPNFSVMGKLVGPIMATPGSVDFGQVEVLATSATTTVEIRNDGAAPATVTGITMGGLMPTDFTILADTCTGRTLDAFKIDPATAVCTVDVAFAPTANGPRTADVVVAHTALNNPLTVRLTGIGGAQAGSAAISVNPVSLEFPDLHTGETSASESVRVSNVGGSAPLVVTATVTGLNAGEFTVTENTCAPEVLPNEQCVIRVNVSPTAAGARTASLELDHNAPLVADPLPVPLSGRGFAGAPAQSASQIPAGFPTWFQDDNGVRVDACLTQGDPGCILLGGPGFNPAQPISFPGNFPPEFFWYMAETDPTFRVEDPACGAIGTASLRVAIEGTFGTGQALPGDQLMFDRIRIGVADLCPNTTYHFVHPYGTDQITTDGDGAGDLTDDLTNMLVNAPLAARTNLADLGGGGLLRWDPVDSPAAPEGYLGDAISFHTVVGSTFRPEGPGTEPANYFEIVADDGVGGPGASLARNEQFMVAGRLAGPIETDVTSVAFGNQAQNTTSTTRTVTVTNLSNDDLTVAPSLGGTNASVFDLLASGTCAIDPVLSRDESCTVDLAFSPTLADAVGTVTASLTIGHDGPHAPTTLAVTGTVTNPGQPEITYTPASIAFTNQNVNTTSVARPVTITNTGTASMTFGNVVRGGTNANQFATADNCPDAPAVLAVGASCTISVTFTPTSTGNKSAQVQINTDDPVRPSVLVTLSGSGVAAQVSASPTSLSMATKGTSSKSVTLTNTGTAPFSLVGAPALVITGTGASKFTAANNGCNNVAPGSKCTINVTFNPGAGPSNQTFTATLTITSNAINSPTVISLTGQRR